MNAIMSHCRRPMTIPLVAMVVVWCALGLGDEPVLSPPMPPLPEDVKPSSVIQAGAIDSARPLPLPLTDAPPSAEAPSGRRGPAGPLGDWTVLVAIGAAFALLAAFRFQQSRRRSRDLPPDVFDVLGEASLGGQHAVRVVRFGPRTLLVSVSSAGCQTLATLDDPQATDRIVTACRGGRIPRTLQGVSRAKGAGGSTVPAAGGEAS